MNTVTITTLQPETGRDGPPALEQGLQMGFRTLLKAQHCLATVLTVCAWRQATDVTWRSTRRPRPSVLGSSKSEQSSRGNTIGLFSNHQHSWVSPVSPTRSSASVRLPNLDGSASDMFNLTGTISNQFRQIIDLDAKLSRLGLLVA